MAVKNRKETKTEQVPVNNYQIGVGEVAVHIVGTATLLMERYSQKAWRELLLPPRKRNRAELAQTLKHDPVHEYQQACYRNRDVNRPTLFHLPNGMLHGALAAIALDIPGAYKAEIVRLTAVVDENVDLYGIPELHMAMVRNSGIGRKPDVRFRPAFKKWAATFTVRYATPLLTVQHIANLATAAGQFIGVGGWRRQKGGQMGSFRVCDKNDPEFKAIVKHGVRKLQERAYYDPKHYDEDVTELMTWYEDEIKRRELLNTYPVVNDDNGKAFDDDDDDDFQEAAE